MDSAKIKTLFNMPSMPRHTEGPWGVEWMEPCYWLIRSDGVHLPPSDANAMLIASATDLVSALETVRRRIDEALDPEFRERVDLDPIEFLLGIFAFVEVKTPKGKLRDSQKQFQSDCDSCDPVIPYLVWRDVRDAFDWLLEIGVITQSDIT